MTDYENECYWLFLSGIEGLGPMQTRQLLCNFETAEGIFKAEERLIFEMQGIQQKVREEIVEKRKKTDPFAEYDRIKKMGIDYYSLQHESYPKRLKGILGAPNGIFCIGKLPSDTAPAIAIIGSRDCSNYGKEICLDFAKNLSLAGFDIISGMAAGIDGFAHRGALNAQGETFAVLGSGADVCYPKSNSDIYARIKKQGGIISEYYPGSNPMPANFPRRNRIISGLSDAILVIEARKRSGTLITVEQGLEQNRDILAVPGRIGDHLSDGCNALIRQGARLVSSPNDVIEELAPKYGYLVEKDKEKIRVNSYNFSAEEEKLYKTISFYPTSINELAAATDFEVWRVMNMLIDFEIAGLCRQTEKGMYARIISN